MFYYTALNGENIAGKVKSVSDDGVHITIISEDDVALDDIFSFAKINTTGDGEGAEVDTSITDDGVSYEGSYSASTFVGAEVNKGVKHSFVVDKEFQNKNETKKVKLSAALSFAINVSFLVKLCWGELSVDLSLSETLALEAQVEGKITSNIMKLAVIYIPTGVPGVMIKEEISLVVEFSAALTFTAQIQAVQGFQLSTKKGFVNKSKTPDFDSDIQISGRIYLGFKSQLSIEVLKIAEIGASGEFGAEVIAETRNRTDTSDTKHKCNVCVEGEVNICAKCKVEISANVWKVIDYEKEKTLYDKKFHLFDFYWSSDKGFGIGKCPNDTYKITLQVVDNNKNPIEGAKVENLTTDSKGQVSDFFSAGVNTVTVSKSGYQSRLFNFEVNGPITYPVVLSVDSGTGSSTSKPGESTVVKENYGGTIIESGVLETNTDISWKLYDNGTLVISGKGKMNFTSGDSPWSGNNDILRVIINEGVKSVGRWAFQGCKSLISVTIPDGVTSIGEWTFGYCYRLTSITIPDSVTRIGNDAFYWCFKLTSITIPDSVTNIGTSTFGGCKSLTSVTIPDSVTSIGDYAFTNCTSLTSVSIPDSVTSINRDAFRGCTSLTSITIPDSVTSIDDYTFMGCNSLTSITIPDSVTSIGDSAFSDCTSLTSITIPDSVTSIGGSAFRGCKSLTSVTIPSVILINSDAFYYCDSLTDVYYNGTESQWKKITIGSGNGCLTSATIHYNSTMPATASALSLRDKGEVASVGAYAENLTTVASDTVNETEISTNGYENTISAQNLVPNAPYVLMVLKGDSTSYSVNTESLLYITDACADEAGNANFTYYCDETEAYVAVVFGTCNHTPGGWITVTEASEDEAGFKAQFCTKCDEVLNSEEIPALNQDGSKLTGIYVEAEPIKTSYEQGENLDLTGMVVKGTYADGSIKEITDYTTSGYDALNKGTQTVTVSSEGFTATFTVEVGDAPDYLLGDVDGDGKVTILDAAMIQKYAAKLITLQDVQIKAADTNADSRISVSDATKIQKYVARMIDTL